MGFLDTALAVTLGNVITLAFVWGCVQFHRHDFRAPWVAYAAFVFPVLLIMVTAYLTEALPPQIAASVPQ